MRHFHRYLQIFLALLFLVEASAPAQTINPMTKAEPDFALVGQPDKSPIKAVPAGRTDPYKGYKFLIRSGTSTVAAFTEYTEIGNASRPPSGKSAGGAGGPQVPVTVPGSLVGSNGSVTLNCTPSSNGSNTGVDGKAIQRNDDWTITLKCAIPYDKVTLQRGVTVDPDFAGWISGSSSGKGRDLTVEAVNEGSKASLGYRLSGCTVGSVKTTPEVAAGAHATNIADLELHCAAVQRY